VATSAATGQWGICLKFLLPLAGLAIVLTYPAYRLTARYYAGGVAEEIAAPASAEIKSSGFTIGGSPLKAHIRRDILLFSRETGVIMQSVIMLVFLLLYPLIASQKGLDALAALPISIFSAMFASFFGGQVGSRLMPLERLGFWQNLAIPNGRSFALAGKLIVGLLFVTICSIIVTIIHIMLGKASGINAVVLTVAFAWIGFAFGVPFGIFFGNFNWDNPKRMLSGGGGFIYAFATILSAMLLYGLAYFMSKFLGQYINTSIIILLISIVFLMISAAVSHVRLANMEWTPNV
jgi:hypothetical protein